MLPGLLTKQYVQGAKMRPKLKYLGRIICWELEEGREKKILGKRIWRCLIIYLICSFPRFPLQQPTTASPGLCDAMQRKPPETACSSRPDSITLLGLMARNASKQVNGTRIEIFSSDDGYSWSDGSCVAAMTSELVI
jgi:hypothetical protein